MFALFVLVLYIFFVSPKNDRSIVRLCVSGSILILYYFNKTIYWLITIIAKHLGSNQTVYSNAYVIPCYVCAHYEFY